MLTDAKLKSQVDQLWDMLWSGGLSNPLDAIEQISFLLFFKRLQDEDDRKKRIADLDGIPFTPTIPQEMRWDHWRNLPAGQALRHLKDKVFPWFRQMGNPQVDQEQDHQDSEAQDTDVTADELSALNDPEEAPRISSFTRYMANAECKLNEADVLITACGLIEAMQITQQNQDVQGDLYEYLLNKLSEAGRNGQFRTPRHIIRMMVKMIDPQPEDVMGDLAGGTAGMIVNMYQHILETHTSPDLIEYDEEGLPHNLLGDKLTNAQREHLQSEAFRGYDNDSGMTLLRIGAMNLMLHGIEKPYFEYANTLGTEFNESDRYTVLVMNPPFKGAINKNTINETLPDNTTKTELLFLHLILRALDMGGRAAVIVPDGVLFGSSKAHKTIRQMILESNRLDGVVSMPGGVFKPYAGVSTAVLLFTKGATTGDEIWFYDMQHDGLTLDDKRQPTAQNDIPDVLACWQERADASFQAERANELDGLRTKVAPLKEQRLALEGEINRLTFESVIAAEDDASASEALEKAKAQLAELEGKIAPIQAQIDQKTNHFWVKKADIVKHGYDLSASRYRAVKQDAVFYEQPGVTMARLLELDRVMEDEINSLEGLLL